MPARRHRERDPSPAPVGAAPTTGRACRGGAGRTGGPVVTHRWVRWAPPAPRLALGLPVPVLGVPTGCGQTAGSRGGSAEAAEERPRGPLGGHVELSSRAGFVRLSPQRRAWQGGHAPAPPGLSLSVTRSTPGCLGLGQVQQPTGATWPWSCWPGMGFPASLSWESVGHGGGCWEPTGFLSCPYEAGGGVCSALPSETVLHPIPAPPCP